MKKILLIHFMLLMSIAGFSQTTVSGKVTDSGGEALPGVNVLVKGTTTGTVTDIEGNYTVTANENATLVFSFVGFVSEEIQVGGQSTINILLTEDVTSLQEVVVIGYGSQKKSVSTAAISTVDAEQVEKMNLPNVGRSLQGMASGVTVTGASGAPGSNPTILIRGVGTNGDNSPLVVIDGIQYTEPGILNSLNPADIESIQILKDAASTAIYGTRGANGVIYITTKKGKSGVTQFSYNGSYVMQSAWRVPEMLNASQYVELINEKYNSAGIDLPLGFPTNSNNLPVNTSWTEELFEASPLQNHNISLSKGVEKGSLFASLSYVSQEGIIAPEKSNFERLTFRINSESEVNNFLNLGNNLTLIGTKNSTIPENNEFGSPIADAMVYDPITPIFDPNAEFGFAQSPYVQKEYINPFSRIFISNTDSENLGISGNLYLDIKPLEWLKFRTDIGVIYNSGSTDFYSPAYQFTPAFFATNSGVGVATYSNFQWQWENYLTFTKTFDRHNIEAVIGTTAIERTGRFSGGGGQNLPEEALFNENLRFIADGLVPDSTETAYSGEEVNRYNTSVFGRVLYNYDERYLFTASVRRDGSSLFGQENRYAIFPAFSAGWVISNEDFFDFSTLDFLKLRVSYGSNGNDRIRPLAFSSVISFGSDYQFGPDDNQLLLNGAAPSSLSNPFLQWEESKQLDVGLEFRMLSNTLSVELDYYQKITDGLLIIDQSTPVIAGNNPSFANVGEIKNSGIEFKIDYNKTFGDFDFGVTLNGATLNNEVTRVDGQNGFINGYTWPVRNAAITRMEVGEPLFHFLGYETDGIFRSDADIFSYINSDGDPIQPNAEPGDLKFVDINGDGQISAEDRTDIGSPWADFTFGLNLRGSYKMFDLSMMFAGQTGNQIYRTFERQDVVNNNYSVEWLDRWSESNPGGSYPRVTIGASAGANSVPSDFYVEDGDYVRLRNIQLGFTLPQNIAEKMKLTKMRLYFSADNLFTVTGYSGLDPEIGVPNYGVSASGIDRGFYPQTKSIGGGVQITF
ncbi:TonB-dependent receptor [Fulvivirga sp. RKSG066]|uniref:SusC/RagA family TonB-linked outer membrane protein n=1 Tax=Fulvivirga aurantia TaxID=2529383 RepID=UPI0012BBFDB8|nr:TonB-dependent receptor [Fulvivirga aurantia]MTI22814.1 TonB-dependent receptor [Fulvivirga aurantia]